MKVIESFRGKRKQLESLDISKIHKVKTYLNHSYDKLGNEDLKTFTNPFIYKLTRNKIFVATMIQTDAYMTMSARNLPNSMGN